MVELNCGLQNLWFRTGAPGSIEEDYVENGRAGGGVPPGVATPFG